MREESFNAGKDQEKISATFEGVVFATAKNLLFSEAIKMLAFVFLLVCWITVSSFSPSSHSDENIAASDTGTYKNPVLPYDYSDPDVIRYGKMFYLIASSFNHIPGIPVLRSDNLIDWELVNHVLQKLPEQEYDHPQHGKGCWAPSIRFNDGKFLVYYGDPDYGIYMVKSDRIEGRWDDPIKVHPAKGWIDPCPFWDDDGSAYLIHAWAKSRAGFNSILTLNRMNREGTIVLDSGQVVFDGHAHHPTIEGPKLYKRNGYYYIFAPAGGVKGGWQVVLRSKKIYGPYEDQIVLHQGSTTINGPHQGGWIETESGESWFIHFQDRGIYGRIVHLQPMCWKDNWPVIGYDNDGDGIGEPVLHWKRPSVTTLTAAVSPKMSDEFNTNKLGLQWQWEANQKSEWISLSQRPGFLRFFPQQIEEGSSLWDLPALLLQKIPDIGFSATVCFDLEKMVEHQTAGIVIFGKDYSYLAVTKEAEGFKLTQRICLDALNGGKERAVEICTISLSTIYARVKTTNNARCNFSYSLDGKYFIDAGEPFLAREGVWVGAKVGLLCLSESSSGVAGFVDIDWFRISTERE